jgi:PST family polysaccharide transporter
MSQTFGHILRFATVTILAWWLVPEYFGIVAMATVVSDLVLKMGGLGFSEAIIQRKVVTENHLATTFWATLALGAVFCGVTVAVSPFVADFYGKEEVGPVLAVASLTFVISPLGAVHAAQLRRNLRFLRLSIVDVVVAVTYMAVAVPLAIAGHGVWSIVEVVLKWVLQPLRPCFVFHVDSLRDLWKFGLSVTGTRGILFVTSRLDYVIIGRLLGSTVLGWYYLALRVAILPADRLWSVVNRVGFPAFSIVQDEDERLRRGFLKSVSFITIMAIPAYAGLAIVAPELVRVLFNENWLEAIVPLQLLCAAECLRLLNAGAPSVFLAKGRPGVNLKLSVVRFVFLLPALLLPTLVFTGQEDMGQRALVFVAVGLAVVSAVMWLVLQVLTNRIMSLSMRAFGSAVMAAVLLPFRYGVSLIGLPDVALLVSSVVLGAVVYVVTLKAARVQEFDEMTSLVLHSVKPIVSRVAGRGPSLRRGVSHAASLPGGKE